MPSKRPEETPSRIKRSLNLTSKNLTKTIEKLQKPKYNTPQKVLLNLATQGNYIITQFGPIVWIYCSTAKDKKKIVKT